MKKKKTANLIMVAIIIAIAVSGILGVGHIKGWFDKSDDASALLTEFRGIITLQRDGIAYATTDETILRKGDKITCDPGATVKIVLGDDYIALGQNADTEVINPDIENFILKINLGEAFVNASESVTLEAEGREVIITNAVANMSVRKGAQSISVYHGSVGEAAEGQMVEWLNGNESIRNFSVKSLNDFNISQIRKANETKSLVFTNEDLDRLEDERFEQIHSADETTVCETAVSETVTTKTTTTKKETTTSISTTAKKEPVTTTAQTTKVEKTTKLTTTKESTTRKTTTKRYTSALSTEATTVTTTKPVTTKKQTTLPVTTTTTTKPVETTKEKLTCTITIRCDTILDNTENLDPAKAPFVPDNGVILREVTVEFEEGETVFDVLNRVCKQYNIQIEYSWTPMYDSYYIEGINNLYEFDCGSESGWMYKVNGWFPNYGCSSYYLTGGENIVWCYTCNGLGEDVGAERWE